MLLTSLLAVTPISASAEEGTTVSIMPEDQVITDVDAVKAICQSYLEYNFETAAEMLAYELELGYLDYIKNGDASVYVNRYTGFMYYVNELTGQILTSNPTDPAYQTRDGGATVSLSNEIMSQLLIEYFSLTDTKVNSYDSLRWIMEGSLLSVSEYEGGLAVQYVLGSAMDSFISPSAMLLDTANETIFYPAFENFKNLMQEVCGDFDSSIADKIGSMRIESNSYDILENDIYRSTSSVYSTYKINPLLDEYRDYALEYLGNANNADYKRIDAFVSNLQTLFNNYDIISSNGDYPTLEEKITALAEGKTIILLKGADTGDITLASCRQVEKALKNVCPSYTLEMVEIHEEECGFNSSSISVPSFKITLAYGLDGGDLIMSVPTNLISFDETAYAIKSITPIKYFGAGDMDRDGYVFYPDGSGAIINFDDFYYGSNSEEANTTVYIEAQVYGSDFCYSTITGAHREQIVMPVYGISNETAAGNIGLSATKDIVRGGYFAIMEQGASLVTLGCESGGGMHKYISVFTEYVPFPSDTYDLSQSISVSGLGSYTVVAAARHEESLRIRYNMLTDEDINASAELLSEDYEGYVSSYVGMAECYRVYLEKEGIIEQLEESYSDLPLYIEALGSIDVTKKFLSFPVTVSTPLTTFEDVARMYSELSNAKATLIAKAEALESEADALAEENETKHITTIVRNRELAENYRQLSEKITDIKNVNFRLTGFTNGGMHYTYPAKVNWESSVGGKSGFNDLLSVAAAESAKDGQTFGIYPDFDFVYINNTSAFDGISNKISACMVDNRYASKQVYSSVNQMFESIFALVVSSDSLDLLYNKFIKKYSAFDVTGISVSTLGSDLNSNFDEDNPVIRESSVENIKSLLGRMSESYSVMTDKGNSYTWKYLDHILNASLDSSHLNNSSYAVSFYGMVLHGYINYAGTPINYSGSPEYEILRSIESGASLYYILCTQNSSYLKEDSLLSQYYGVDYENWFEQIVEQYTVLNNAIGDLQQHRIVDHSTVLCERVINDADQDINNRKLLQEFLDHFEEAISDNIDRALKKMREEGKIGQGLKFSVTTDSLSEILDNAAERLNLSAEELCERYDFDRYLTNIISDYSEQYSEGSESVTISSSDVDYKSRYKYVTDSIATDENYVKTDYTCDNGNVVMVTYEREVNGEKDRVVFLLNYNVFSVKIRIDDTVHASYADYCDEDGYITIDSFGYVKIEG